MTDIKHRLNTPTSIETFKFINGLGGIEKASEMLQDIVPPVPRFHAAWLKEMVNLMGARCGYVDIMYTDANVENKRENATSLAFNIFPTSDIGSIYYSPTYGSYIMQTEPPDGDLYFSKKYYKVPPMSNDLMQNKMSNIMTGYHSPDNAIDFIKWNMNIWSIRRVIDYDRAIAPVTMDRLIKFIGNIKTPDKIYEASEQQCLDYAIQTRKKANSNGIKCGIVTLFMGWETEPQTYLPSNLVSNHVMNVFKTTDMGMIFVEPQLRDGFSDPPIIGSNIQTITNDIYSRLDPKYVRAPTVHPSAYIVYFQQFVW